MDNSKQMNQLLENSKEQVQVIKKAGDKVTENMRGLSLQLKLFSCAISLFCIGFFTKVRVSYILSFIFAIIAAMSFYTISTFACVVFIILFIIYISGVIRERNKSFGIIIKPTDIYRNSSRKAFMCDVPPTNDNIIASNIFRDEVNNHHYTFSVFLYINGSNPTYKNNFQNYRFREWKSVFYLGENSINNSMEFYKLRQLPGLWLKPTLNNLVFVMNDGSSSERAELEDLPMNEWFNITMVVQGASVAIYKNCKLEIELSLKNIIPNTSQYNLYLANDAEMSKSKKNGYAGQMAFLSYYASALNQTEINQICSYYHPLLKKYQHKQDKGISYETSCLVTNSDVKSL